MKTARRREPIRYAVVGLGHIAQAAVRAARAVTPDTPLEPELGSAVAAGVSQGNGSRMKRIAEREIDTES